MNSGDYRTGASAVASAAAELYAAAPEEFTERRKALAARAREAGDREAARQIGALRKPTRAAWVVNQLSRADPGASARLADLAAGLRDAEQARDGRRLRELSARRRTLLDDLASQAFAAAGLPDPPSALRDEVTETLAAALADPEVAADVESGTLTRQATWSGFGLASAAGAELPGYAGAPGDAEAGTARDAAEAGEVPVAPVPLPPQAPRALPPQRSRGPQRSAGGARPPAAGRPSAPAPPASPAPAGAFPSGQLADLTPAPVSRLAPRRSPAHQADVAGRSPAEDAERALATAAEIAAAASAAEELLEDHVRDLEQQLTKARADLAEARRKARHAESAERKARQARDRLQPPQ